MSLLYAVFAYYATDFRVLCHRLSGHGQMSREMNAAALRVVLQSKLAGFRLRVLSPHNLCSLSRFTVSTAYLSLDSTFPQLYFIQSLIPAKGKLEFDRASGTPAAASISDFR